MSEQIAELILWSDRGHNRGILHESHVLVLWIEIQKLCASKSRQNCWVRGPSPAGSGRPKSYHRIAHMNWRRPTYLAYASLRGYRFPSVSADVIPRNARGVDPESVLCSDVRSLPAKCALLRRLAPHRPRREFERDPRGALKSLPILTKFFTVFNRAITRDATVRLILRAVQRVSRATYPGRRLSRYQRRALLTKPAKRGADIAIIVVLDKLYRLAREPPEVLT